jgi:hypothetical protein
MSQTPVLIKKKKRIYSATSTPIHLHVIYDVFHALQIGSSGTQETHVSWSKIFII